MTTTLDTVPAAHWSEMRDVDLTPRATAVMVALRSGPRSRPQLRSAIADSSLDETLALLRDMHKLGVIESTGACWQLTIRGVAWLQQHGMDASESAKREIYPVRS